MKNVAIYTRFPFDNDGGLDVVGKIKEFALNKPEWIVTDVFIDRNCKITNDDRPEFEKLLEKCKTDKIDIILVPEIFYITRSVITLFEIEKRLSENNVVLYSKSLDKEVELTKLLENINIDSLVSYLTRRWTEEERIKSRYVEMQSSFKTLYLMRTTLNDNIVQEENLEHLVEAHDYINQVEKRLWNYVYRGNCNYEEK